MTTHNLPLEDHALAQLFRSARSRNRWRKEASPEPLWQSLYDRLKFGPASANVYPARFVFVTSEQDKVRVLPHLSQSNRKKSLDAPAIVIIGKLLTFAETLPQFFPHNSTARHWFFSPEFASTTAGRNTVLQGVCLIVTERALSLDTGQMSGFDNVDVEVNFFADTPIRSEFTTALGHGIDEPCPVFNSFGQLTDHPAPFLSANSQFFASRCLGI